MRKNHFSSLFCAAMATVVFIGMLTGCSTKKHSENYAKIDGSDTVEYNTNDSTDPQNYTTYVNKEINLVLNILETHVATGDHIIIGKAIINDEIKAVTADLDMVAEAIESVETLKPPTDYEDDRDTILQKLVNAQSSLSEYRSALSDNSDDLQSAVDLMESDYISLSGSFNLPWE